MQINKLLISLAIISLLWASAAQAAELTYIPVTPCSIVDTRNTAAGRIDESEERDFHVYGSAAEISAQGGNAAGCPSPGGEPLAVHINMIAVDPTGKGNVTAFPLDSASTDGLSVNYNNTIGTNLANAGTVGTATGSGSDITVKSNFADAHVTIRAMGYYYPGAEPPPPPNDDEILEWCNRDACAASDAKYNKCITFLPICLAGADTDADQEQCVGAGLLICWENEL